MANIKKYLDEVLSEDDKTLFQEAVSSASKGAPRGAYILIWIACAESLKRKFKEASLRDGQAGRIVGEIQDGEDNHRSVDLLILDRAKSYGFIDDTTFQKLKHVYDLRCLYGHPYETAPTDLEILSAADVIVTEVLAKPTLLRHGFVDRLISQLFGDINFLEQNELSVRPFASDIADRIHPSAYFYLLEKYSEKIEASFRDATLNVVTRRGLWFLREFLEKVGTSFYTATQWHDFTSRYPYTAQAVLLANLDVYATIGVRARDYIISYMISESAQRPTLLKRLERLYEFHFMSDSQVRRFQSINIATASAANLKVTSCFLVVIEALKSHDWYKQNPAAVLVKSSARSDIRALSQDDQVLLGRNILQAADGSSGESIGLIDSYVEDQSNLPEGLIKGIVFECFVNEDDMFRFKLLQTGKALQLLKTHPSLITELSNLVNTSQPKGFISSSDYDLIQAAAALEPELALLNQTLIDNKERLITVPDF
jgi:hypothetical protein